MIVRERYWYLFPPTNEHERSNTREGRLGKVLHKYRGRKNIETVHKENVLPWLLLLLLLFQGKEEKSDGNL